MIIRSWLYFLLKANKNAKKNHGFTLMELLISMVVVGMVMSGLLYLVNEVIRIDRQEANLENVQRDMQRAMDYITDELRESVYVYPIPTDITNLLTPADLPPASATSPPIAPVPVLAFWKPESLSAQDHARLPANCTTLAAPQDDNCQALKLRQSYYSLVVYYAFVNVDDNPNWPGLSRIIRYSLPQYTQTVLNAGTAVQTSGFSVPNNDFGTWIPAAGQVTDGNWSVLVDYLDSSGSAYGPLVLPATVADLAATPPDLAGGCDEFGNGYVRSPIGNATPTNLTGLSYSFIACVGQPGVLGNGVNQDIVLLLRGNIKTAAQELSNPTPTWTPGNTRPSSSVLPTLKSQVLVRGAANKNP